MKGLDVSTSDFTPDHWSRDWDLLRRVHVEFQSLRQRFQWKPLVQYATVDKQKDNIIGNAEYPAINQLYGQMTVDIQLSEMLSGLLLKMEKTNRIRCAHPDLLDMVILRLNLTIWRKSGDWIEEYGNRLQHWAVFRNGFNLEKEIERSNKVLCPPGQALEVASVDDYPFLPACTHDGFDFVDDIDELVTRGVISPVESKCMKLWCDSSDEEDPAAIVGAKFNVGAAEIHKIIRKVGKALASRQTVSSS